MLSTKAMGNPSTDQAAIGRPGLSTMVRAASSAIPAGRCKSAPVTLAARLLVARPVTLAARLLVARPVTLAARLLVAPVTLAARLLAIRSPPAFSASGHTIRKLELIWATMASAIPVREPHC
jgi:hypothetical protein